MPLTCIGFIALLSLTGSPAQGSAPASSESSARSNVIRIETGREQPVVQFLSWDTERGDRIQTNLLANEGIQLFFREADQWRNPLVHGITRGDSSAVTWTEYALTGSGDFRYRIALGREWMEFKCNTGSLTRDSLQVRFSFRPVTPTSVIPSAWTEGDQFQLPAVLSAPDFGQMRVNCPELPGIRGAIVGDRNRQTIVLSLELPLRTQPELTLRFEPLQLPPPAGLHDAARWRLARRGWFGALQTTSQWGDAHNPRSSPPGLLANNVLSDPASPSIWMYADQAFWTPQLAPDVSILPTLQRTLDYWLDHKVLPTGEMIGYWAYAGFLDGNAGPLIAAWDYFESGHDRAWLKRRIERLEFVADYLVKRDIDGDGLVEATQSGNDGALVQPNRSCAWWDAVNCGHKDAYTNAIIYRGWRCLADLERQLGRQDQYRRYTMCADHLKKTYRDTLFNPQTGWLAWWKSQDGTLHDYAAPTVNGMAIEYGLVNAQEGKLILKRLRDKMQAVGFTRFDLGVPCALVPLRRLDYLLPEAIGCPHRDDGSDTLGQYMNGGITAGQVLHFLAAHYVVNDPEPADRILDAMLQRQQRGEFQNGIRNSAMKGIDWTDWNGKPTGYEGYLADSFRFLQAVLLRDASLRERFYRPLTP